MIFQVIAPKIWMDLLQMGISEHSLEGRETHGQDAHATTLLGAAENSQAV